MTSDEDLDDDVWSRLGGPPSDPEATGAEQEVEIAPPVRVTVVVRAAAMPVAPWPQGWRVGVLGPEDGKVMLVFEHDIDLSPVAQLSAVVGLLGVIKGAQLELSWWGIQARGPLVERDAVAGGIDAEFGALLDGDVPAPPDAP